MKDLYIIGDVTDLIAALDESLVTVNTVLGSRYVGGIREFVEGWRKNLILFQDTLDEWLACQRAWMYLETIFASADIIRQLPAAAKKFQAVDKSWKATMKATADDPTPGLAPTRHAEQRPSSVGSDMNYTTLHRIEIRSQRRGDK